MNSVGADLQMFKSGSNNRGVAEVKDINFIGRRKEITSCQVSLWTFIGNILSGYLLCLLTQARKSLNVVGFSLKFHVARSMKLVAGVLGCNNSHFSLLLAAGNVLRGVTSATQWQKFHSYVRHKVSVSILKIWYSPWVPNSNLFNFTFSPGWFWRIVVFICQWAPAKLKCFF